MLSICPKNCWLSHAAVRILDQILLDHRITAKGLEVRLPTKQFMIKFENDTVRERVSFKSAHFQPESEQCASLRHVEIIAYVPFVSH